mmetsp:Transcript_47877/g.136924  ORF Transcript_47877/g.136924 Transcript_47877/m.136924 type:complete len:275 (+) Transcript_47877:311-1135(+)
MVRHHLREGARQAARNEPQGGLARVLSEPAGRRLLQGGLHVSDGLQHDTVGGRLAENTEANAVEEAADAAELDQGLDGGKDAGVVRDLVVLDHAERVGHHLAKAPRQHAEAERHDHLRAGTLLEVLLPGVQLLLQGGVQHQRDTEAGTLGNGAHHHPHQVAVECFGERVAHLPASLHHVELVGDRRGSDACHHASPEHELLLHRRLDLLPFLPRRQRAEEARRGAIALVPQVVPQDQEYEHGDDAAQDVHTRHGFGITGQTQLEGSEIDRKDLR